MGVWALTAGGSGGFSLSELAHTSVLTVGIVTWIELTFVTCVPRGAGTLSFTVHWLAGTTIYTYVSWTYGLIALCSLITPLTNTFRASSTGHTSAMCSAVTSGTLLSLTLRSCEASRAL